MNLVIDIGNTRTKLGFFEEKKCLQQAFLQDWTLLDIQNSLQKMPTVRNVILAASGNVPPLVEEWLSVAFHYIRLSHLTPLPIRNDYATPETLGRDRLAGVIGAWNMFPKQNCLKIDAGTCITYDWLTKAGHYKGGIIAPGMSMRLKAMHAFTARLPEVSITDAPQLTGDSTWTAMQSGAQWGIIMEIKGFIQAYNDQYGDVQVLLSGGDAAFLKQHLSDTIISAPDLVLHGLNTILRHNLSLL